MATLYQTGNFQDYTLNMPGGTGTGTGTWTVNESMATFPTSFPILALVWDTDGTFNSTREIVEITATNVGAKQMTINTRGVDGTSAVNHANASKLRLCVVAAMLNNMVTEINTKAALVTGGSAGTNATNAGTATTAARSDHEHSVYFTVPWDIPSPATGDTQGWWANKFGYDITMVSAYAVAKTAGTTASTINIYTCTQTNIDGSPSWTTIFSTPITLDSNERSSNTAAAPPVLSTTTLASGNHLKVEYTSVGTNVGETTVILLCKAKNTS